MKIVLCVVLSVFLAGCASSIRSEEVDAMQLENGRQAARKLLDLQGKITLYLGEHYFKNPRFLHRLKAYPDVQVVPLEHVQTGRFSGGFNEIMFKEVDRRYGRNWWSDLYRKSNFPPPTHVD
jgi:hypothetical protein